MAPVDCPLAPHPTKLSRDSNHLLLLAHDAVFCKFCHQTVVPEPRLANVPVRALGGLATRFWP